MPEKLIRIVVVGSEYFKGFVQEIRLEKKYPSIYLIYVPIIHNKNRDTDYSRMLQTMERLQPDIFIAGPANADKLAKYSKTPYYTIRPSITDFLALCPKLEDISKTCIVLPHTDDIDLTLLEQATKIYFRKVYYNDYREIKVKLQRLRSEGYTTVIGNNSVVTLAREMNLSALYYYSKDGMVEAIDHAILMIKNLHREENFLLELQSLLSYTFNGVISTSQDGEINYVNEAATNITKLKKERFYGENISKFLHQDIVDHVLKDGIQENNISLNINGQEVLANFIPLKVGGIIQGACLILENLAKILEMESSYRREIKRKNFLTRYSFDSMIAKSDTMLAAVKKAKLYARSDATLMIKGETGVGKEVFAQSIHDFSSRRQYPFVAINCSAIPETLIESELFGYETGSFTGASTKGKQGLIDLAHHGTVFLDDIDAIPLSFQVKILRVIQEREIIRIGGKNTIPIDVRFIVATNRDLRALVEEKQFRNDLYYRLNVLSLQVPALRDRKADVPELFRYYIGQINPQLLEVLDHLFPDFFQIVKQYDYPGNVRELIGICERFCILADTSKMNDRIYLEQLIRECIYNDEEKNEGGQIELPIGKNYLEDVKEAEKAVLKYYLDLYGSEDSNLYKKLGIGRTTLYNKMKEL